MACTESIVALIRQVGNYAYSTLETQMANNFKEYGKTLIENGFNILPIVPHDAKDHSSPGKAPALKGWQEYTATAEDITKWSRSR